MGHFWMGLSLFAALRGEERPLFGAATPFPTSLRWSAPALAAVVVLAVLAQSAGSRLSRRRQ